MNTIIEKIRAEVNRLKPRIRKICGEEVKIPVEKVREKFDTLLSILSDLEKEEKPTNIDFEQELYKHFGQVKDFTLGMQIGKYFYELGKQEKPNSQWSEEDEEMLNSIIATCKLAQEERDSSPARHLFKKQERWLKSHYSNVKSEKPIEGLEEEIKRYYDDWDGDCRYTQTARHFAKWGAEHLKK